MRLFVIKFSIRARKQLKKTLLKDERKFVIKKLIALNYYPFNRILLTVKLY